MTTAAVVLAGGSGTRVRRAENKVYLPLGERHMLSWSLAFFESSPLVDHLVLVVRGIDLDKALEVTRSIRSRKLRAIVEGGATRHASERAGIEVLSRGIENGVVEMVLVHDAARPFVSRNLLQRVLDGACETGGAVPVLPVSHRVLEQTSGGMALVSGENLRGAQTPQAFAGQPLLVAHRDAGRAGFVGTDTAEVMQRFTDVEITAVRGDPRNIKVTFIEDFFSAERIAAEWPAP